MRAAELMRTAVHRLTAPRDDLVVSRWVFLRTLAVITFIAFLSFHLQFPGLIGERGILPVQDTLQNIEGNMGAERYWQFPTLSWIDASNTGIAALTIGGMLLSILLFLNVAPRIVLFLLWLSYLSITVNGSVFMSYQWDILLIESLFLSIFLAPTHIWPSKQVSAPTNLAVWMLRFLLFKLMFLSGISKLLSNDAAWQELTALTYHYYTQPLPNPIAWVAYQLPAELHMVTTGLVLALEIIVPVFIFTPARYRKYAAYGLILLQVGILSTGNYAFFNYNALVLTLLLFTDAQLTAIKRAVSRIGARVTESIPTVPSVPISVQIPTAADRTPGFQTVITVLLVLVLLVNVPILLGFVGAQPDVPVVDEATTIASRFHVANTYALFAVMTTERPEIIVQGSNNGEDWKTYDFKYKPDNAREAPPVVAPHQPRLDWQLWFAAMKPPRQARWFHLFAAKLLQGSDDVEALLADNPFPDEPPAYIRAVHYRYEFTDWHTYRSTGQWWTRERTGLYLQPVSLQNR